MPVQPFLLLLGINGAQGGKNEKYWLMPPAAGGSGGGTVTVPNDAVYTLAKDIAFGRTAFFGAGALLTYARISLAGGPPDRNPVQLPYPLGPHPVAKNLTGGFPDSINVDADAIYFMEHVAGAMGANRYLNFLQDGWVVNGQRLAPGALAYLQAANTPPAPGSLPSWGGSHVALCQAWLALLKASTFVGKKQTPTSYVLQQIDDVIFRNVTKRNVGGFIGQHRGRRQKATIK